jgi:hypothetical protein
MAPDPMSPSQALDAAASDADANAGPGNVGDPVGSCAGTSVPESGPSGSPSSGPSSCSSPSSSPSSVSSSKSSSQSSSSPSSSSRSSASSQSSSSSSPTSSLWVRIALTQAQARVEQGSLRLHGSTGGFDQTVAIAKTFEANDNGTTVDVPFHDVPTTHSYSLIYIAADGTQTTVLNYTPFEKLRDPSPPA